MDRRGLLKAGMVGVLGHLLDFWPVLAEEPGEGFEIMKTDEEWRAILTAEQYAVLRKEKTEPPFKNVYHNHKARGVYDCAGCDLPLFSSDTKYDSRTGWPSFGSRSNRRRSGPRPIGSFSTLGPKCIAGDVAVTWDISSMMALPRRGLGIVSTRRH